MACFRNFKILIIITSIFIFFISCASIPAEAPELSAELGIRISEIQATNLTLLHRFFDLKRDEVDRFIRNEWVLTFAEEIFSDPKMQNVWDTIVSENNPGDRLKFLVTTGPKLQERINQKRIELIKPLDEVEARIEEALKYAYTEAIALNNSITSLLLSASKVDDNRKRYLEIVGIKNEKISNAIDKVNDTVNDLILSARTTDESILKAEDYLDRLREIRDSL